MSNDAAPNSDDAAPPRRVRDVCLYFHVQRAARALARHYDRALRPAGITGKQFSLLIALSRPDPPPMGRLAAALGFDRTTLTANLKPLVRQGLVEVATDPDDKRARRMSLTDAGRDTIHRARPLWEKAQNEAEARLADQSPDAFRAALRAFD